MSDKQQATKDIRKILSKLIHRNEQDREAGRAWLKDSMADNPEGMHELVAYLRDVRAHPGLTYFQSAVYNLAFLKLCEMLEETLEEEKESQP